MGTMTCSRDDVFGGNLILVSRAHPIRRSVAEGSLAPIADEHPGILLQRCAQVMLAEALSALHAEQYIVPVSGYRSLQEQTWLYEESLRVHGREFTQRFVALPNASEHQTGLAIDLGENKSDLDPICPDFGHAVCRAFRRQAGDYGFVERYPAGKEAITGIGCEPWHYRYVGRPHAAIMRETGLVLEEYVDYLRAFPEHGRHLLFDTKHGMAEVYYVAFPDGESEVTIELPEHARYEVSGNNVDGLVVTLWRNGR